MLPHQAWSHRMIWWACTALDDVMLMNKKASDARRPKLTTTTNELTPKNILITLVFIIVGGYFGYATAFPDDRKQVRSCISSMLESSRGQVGYGELRDKLSSLDAAETVAVVSERLRDFGGSDLVTIEYQVDGRNSRITCGR